jgi:hypothetical protein
MNKSYIRGFAPIFIVGCQHSGTSIVHRLLGYHSAIFQLPQETRWFSAQVINHVSKAQILAAVRVQHLFLADAFLEKTPSSINHIDLIWRTFPQARVIFMVRDPRDVVASTKARGIPMAKSLENWRQAAQIILEHQHLPQCLAIRLEDLVSDPCSTMNLLQDFLGLKNEDLISAHGLINKRFYSVLDTDSKDVTDGQGHNRHRNWQINQPLFSSTTRWNDELSSEEVSKVVLNTSEFYRRLGYSIGSKAWNI